MRRAQILHIISLTLLTGIPALVHAQTMPSVPPEKFMLFTDRDLYFEGETLWFTARDLLGADKDLQSKVLYVELYNRRGQAPVRQKHKLENGRCAGSLIIPEQLPSDYYYLRIYTAMLRNYPPEYYATKRITVINPEIPAPSNSREKEDSFQLLLPNGGLVPGLKNRGYIWFSGKGPLPDEVSIRASRKEIIGRAKYLEQGIFAFEFEVQAGVRYEVLADLQEVDSSLVELPVSGQGFLVNTEVAYGTLRVDLKSNVEGFKALSNQTLQLELFDDNYQQMKSQEFSCTKQDQQVVLPVDDLPVGIYYLRMLNDMGDILWLSLINLYPSADKAIDISLDKNVFKQGERVEFDVIPVNAEAKVSYSVSVVKKGTSNSVSGLYEEIMQNPEQAMSQFIQSLSTGLFNAASICYVDFHGEGFQQHLDHQTDTVDMKYLPETRAVAINGMVTDKTSGKALASMPVFMAQIDAHSRVHVTTTKEDGSFAIPLYHRTGWKDLFLRTLEKNGTQPLIRILADFSNEYPPVSNGYPVFDTSDKTLFEEIWLNQQLSGYTPPLDKTTTPDNYDSLFGLASPEFVVKLEEYIDLPDMETVLNEIVPFVSVRKRKGNYYLTVFDDKTGVKFDHPMILMDNMLMSDINRLLQVHPSRIQDIRVFNRMYFLGNNLFPGILVIKSQTGDFAGIPLPDDAVFVKYQTLQSETRFLPLEKDNMSFRNVLYWSPFDGNEQMTDFSFYTSNHLAEYEIIVKGYSEEAGFFEVREGFRVEK